MNQKTKRNRTRKKKSKKRSKTRRKMGGTGLLIKNGHEAAEQQFYFFISNSTLRYMSSGSNGVTAVATLNPGVISPYTSMDSRTYGNPVNKIIVKFILVSVIPEMIELTNGGGIKSTIMSSVIEEVNIQTDISLKTINYLDPLCPCPVYFNPSVSYDTLKDIIKPAITNDTTNEQLTLKGCIDKMLKLIVPTSNTNRYKAISIIGMEFADNYKNLFFTFENFNEDVKERCINMARYILIKLAIDTEYTHGDYHPANIMINMQNTNYFDEMEESPMLIDFGYSSKIQPNTMKIIRGHFENKQYTQILDILSNIPRKDGLIIRDYPRFYGYIYGVYWNYRTETEQHVGYKPNTNNQINRLFRLRNVSIRNTSKHFEELHKNNPMYPLLPLPNSIKNKTFNGVDVQLETVKPVFHFSPEHVKRITIYLNGLYKAFMEVYLDQVYSLSQKRCFFIVSCYNFIYILNQPFANNFIQDSRQFYNLALYSVLSLLFVDNFDIEDNKFGYDTFEFIHFVTGNKYGNDTVITNVLSEIYPCFNGKKVNSGLAPLFANTYENKDDIIGLMLNPVVYSNPESLLRLVGPVQPTREPEPIQLPFQEDV